MSAAVRVQRGGQVVEVVLDRPERRNALRDEDVAALRAVIADVAVDSGVRAVLLRGEGKAFCAGRDLSTADPADEDGGEVLDRVYNPLVADLAALAVPTVAAVQGACLGAGLGLALACDVVLVADDAMLGSPFARIGAVLDSGAHRFLVDRVGPHRTLELVYTGRLLRGREAAAWGLANRAVAGSRLLPVARQLVEQIATGPTATFRASKRLVAAIRDEGLALPDVLAAEAAAQSAASRTDDYAEGIAAFQQKRTPAFRGH
ncbi:enoyl-CoA hydratase-related protein [Dactylosporangium sp. AC04546]|uniref:enoyl-CoA hydratase/isomerase family protein n=1 Tax=Dactylosporangium sp. AC04546 TaxID=2862460 RepID=UPI001EDF9562|nr:enoyl-CoA hydratase-related protein [Dactylosporangium sp. AC04546]WVK88993.1 enoyl-CoA hydratase-related protein [Dactylosporangium sp. AC04546]